MTQDDRELFELGFGLYHVWRLKLVNFTNRTRDLTAEQAAIHNKTAIQFSFNLRNWPTYPCSNSNAPTIEVLQVGRAEAGTQGCIHGAHRRTPLVTTDIGVTCLPPTDTQLTIAQPLDALHELLVSETPTQSQ